MAVRFDAATDRLSVAASPPDPAAGITITAWAYLSTNTGTNATMLRLHAAGGASTTITFATNGAAPAAPGYFTGGGSVVSSTQAPVGEWRRVALTCVGTAGTVYVAPPTGPTDTDTGSVAGAASPTGVTLGGRSAGDGSEPYDGRLAHVRVWSGTPSTLVEVEAEWASAVPVRTSGLWADWPLEVHTDLTDHSGHGRHLTAGSTAVTTEAGPPIATTVTGTGAATAPLAVVSGAGAVVVSGTGSATAAPTSGAGSGTVPVTGISGVSAPAAVTAGTGLIAAGATGTAVAPAATVSGAGGVLVVGSGAAVAPPAVVAGSDTTASVTPPGRTRIVPAANRTVEV